jgi:hypothetical protein
MVNPDVTGSIGTGTSSRFVSGPAAVQVQQQAVLPVRESCTGILCPGFPMIGVGY